jgi:dTDP-4-dehydrorhamnose reductase
MKIVLIEPDNLIGDAIETLLPKETDYELCTIKLAPAKVVNESWNYVLDMKDRKNFRRIILNEKPDVIINCAIITNEDEKLTREQIWAINVDLNDLLISTAKIADIHYITFSNEIIFDGKRGPYLETDVANPTSYVGKSILARENACKTEIEKVTLFRTSQVFGYSNYNVLDEIAQIYIFLQTGIDLNVKNTMIHNPVWNYDVARAVINAIERRRYGIFNLGGPDFLNEQSKTELVAKAFATEDVVINVEDAKEIKRLGLINLLAQTDLRVDFTHFENALSVIKYNMDTNIKFI